MSPTLNLLIFKRVTKNRTVSSSSSSSSSWRCCCFRAVAGAVVSVGGGGGKGATTGRRRSVAVLLVLVEDDDVGPTRARPFSNRQQSRLHVGRWFLFSHHSGQTVGGVLFASRQRPPKNCVGFFPPFFVRPTSPPSQKNCTSGQRLEVSVYSLIQERLQRERIKKGRENHMNLTDRARGLAVFTTNGLR